MENYDFRLTNTLGFPVVLNKTTVNTWKKNIYKINTNALGLCFYHLPLKALLSLNHAIQLDPPSVIQGLSPE